MIHFLRTLLCGLVVLSAITSFARSPVNMPGAQDISQLQTESVEYIAKLPSIAGSQDGHLWVLDARGERLMRVHDGQTDTVDLWLPDGSNFAYVNDLVAHDGWVYLEGTYKDAVYRVAIPNLLALWAKTESPAARIKLERLKITDPLLPLMRQHFLRSGLWLSGQSRQALLDRAKSLAQAGWPVHTDTQSLGSVRFDPQAAANGQLCMVLDPAQFNPNKSTAHIPKALRKTRNVQAKANSTACTNLPSGWQVGAIYPVGLRPIASSETCTANTLGPNAQWLWMEVDLMGESQHSIESRTLLMRAAVDNGKLQCWDTQGFSANAQSRASLMRLFALVGATPTTLLAESDARWYEHPVSLSQDFWPAPLQSAVIHSQAPTHPTAMQEVLDRALPYAQQSWVLPADTEAEKRYETWQKEGFFARCFPEIEACGKPLGPRYLAQGKVQNSYVGLPYGWGGSDTPEAYLKRIASGAYPGDIHTNNVILKTIAGVDCSGFITNVWQLPQRVVTTCRGGPDAWTPKPGDNSCVGAFSSRVNWQSALAGDALLIPGHVRLVAQAIEPTLAQSGRGQFIEIIESSGFCAGACHRLLPAREAGRYRMMRPKL